MKADCDMSRKRTCPLLLLFGIRLCCCLYFIHATLLHQGLAAASRTQQQIMSLFYVTKHRKLQVSFSEESSPVIKHVCEDNRGKMNHMRMIGES